MYRFGQYLLNKPFHARCVIVLCSVIPLLGFFASIILGLVTLEKSTRDSAIALALLCVTNLIYAACLYATHDIGIAYLSFVSAALVGGVFIWGAALLLRYYQAWLPILLTCIIITLLGLFAIQAYIPALGDWIGAVWLASVQTRDQVLGISNPFDSPALLPQLVNYVAGGVIATFLYSFGVAQVCLARWWQGHLAQAPGSLRTALHQIRIPFVCLILLLLFGMLLWQLKSPLLYGMVPIAVLTWLIAGLSLIHRFCYQRKAGWLYVVLIYIGLLFLGHYVLPAVLLVACIDSAIDFRRRFFTA